MKDLWGVLQGIKKLTDLNELRKQWRAVADRFTKHKWIYRYIKDEKQEEMLHKYYNILCDENSTYGEYKRAFKFYANFMGLPAKEIIIENVIFETDKQDKGQKKVSIKYSRGIAKVKLPEDIHLIHVSPADNIQNLEPSFRSKVKGKYMYPTKRCFFTVAKNISTNKAGLEKQKLTRYTTKDNISTAYIDPTYADFASGSVYIETDKSIPVEKEEKKFFGIFTKLFGKTKRMDNINESYDMIDEDIDFEDSNYLQLVEEISLSEFISMIKSWKTRNENHKIQEFVSNTITDDEYVELEKIIDDLKHKEKFSEYSKAFKALCKFAHISPEGTIITEYKLTKGKREDNNTLIVKYSYNTKKIKLPEGVGLFHMSKVSGIKKLIPQFRGKSERGYLYDKPRIYFTVNKWMPRIAADYGFGTKIHKYRAKENIRDVYVDPLVWNKLSGAVYIQTNKEVPVEDLNEKKPEEIKEEEKKNIDDNPKEDVKKEQAVIEYFCELGLEIEEYTDLI